MQKLLVTKQKRNADFRAKPKGLYIPAGRQVYNVAKSYAPKLWDCFGEKKRKPNIRAQALGFMLKT